MNPAWFLARGALVGLALSGLAAHGLWLSGQALPDALLPAGLVVGWLLAWRIPAPGQPASPPTRSDRWLALACALVLAATLAALCRGVLATPERDWDGAVSWGLRARWLARAPTLEQPVFRDPHVFSHSLDYPLLQPMALAACLRLLGETWGRLWFPVLWLLLVALAGGGARRGGLGAGTAWLTALGVGTLPALVSPGGGSVDSGYGELLLLAVMTAAAAALVRRDLLLLATAAMLLPWAKPEGAVYGAALLLATGCCAPTRDHAAASVGLGLGLAAWLPLYRSLTTATPMALLAAWPAAAVLLASLAAKAWVVRAGVRPARALAGAALGFALILLLAGWALRDSGGTRGVIATSYLAGLARVPERLPRIPWILLGLVQHLGNPRRFGCLFLALAVAALLRRPLRMPPWPTPALGLWLLLALPIVVLPFLVSPEPDLDHHLRSSMGRLLLHWSGAAWLLAAPWCERAWLAPPPQPR